MLDGILLAGSVHRTMKNKQTNLASSQATAAATDAKNKSNILEGDVDKLFMITEALWEILKTEHGYTDEKLMDKIQEIDLKDGQLDGKCARSKIKPDCPNCGKKLMGNRPVCLYCGTAVALNPFD